MSNIVWTYEKRKISDLIENKKNPRRLSKVKSDFLKKSLDTFGVCQPLVIQPDGQIIGGHQRLKTLMSLGVEEVDVSMPSRELTKDEADQLTIGLNKIQGEFDFDMLANQWDPNLLLDSGFSPEELESDYVAPEKSKNFSISLKFDNEDDLHFVEKILNTVISDFPSAKMKVKVS